MHLLKPWKYDQNSISSCNNKNKKRQTQTNTKKQTQRHTITETDRTTKKVIRERENHTHASPACRNFTRSLVTCAHLYLFDHWIPVVCPDIWPRSWPLAASEGSQHTTHNTFSPNYFLLPPPPSTYPRHMVFTLPSIPLTLIPHLPLPHPFPLSLHCFFSLLSPLYFPYLLPTLLSFPPVSSPSLLHTHLSPPLPLSLFSTLLTLPPLPTVLPLRTYSFPTLTPPPIPLPSSHTFSSSSLSLFFLILLLPSVSSSHFFFHLPFVLLLYHSSVVSLYSISILPSHITFLLSLLHALSSCCPFLQVMLFATLLITLPWPEALDHIT